MKIRDNQIFKFLQSYKNYIISLTPNAFMKHFNIEDIVNRRKSIKLIQKKSTEQSNELSKCLDKQIRQINDSTIDHLIRIAIRGDTLSQQTKLDILQVIACKTGINLNKHVVGPSIDLVYCPQVMQLSSNWLKANRSYLILRGQLMMYEFKGQKYQMKFNTQPPSSKNKTIYEDQDLQTFATVSDFQKVNREFEMIQQFGGFRSVGNILNPPKEQQLGQLISKQIKRIKLIAIDAILIQIKSIDRQYDALYNDGIGNDEKIELLNHFPVLRLMGKKLNNFINSFKLKQFSLKELIYKQGEKPKSVYFIIRGEIGFQLLLDDQSNQKVNVLNATQINKQHGFLINTQTFGETSYFGDQEILYKSSRMQSAKCISSKCMVLELEKDKFQRFLENPEFNQLVTKAAKVKKMERDQKLAKARSILLANQSKTKKQVSEGLTEADIKQLIVSDRNQNKRKFSTRTKNQGSVKIMHGNIIRQLPLDNQPINFSMLQVNPDMYEAAKKKFRRYSVKPLVYEKRKSWDFKKVWKILNLEDVLRQEQMEIGSPQGRKFFDCHKRLMHQLNETKSMRPKTTSSNYRTKLQYIAYLQQFNQ